MPRLSSADRRPLAPTAPSRRRLNDSQVQAASQEAAGSTADVLAPVTAFTKVLRQRELARASRQGGARPRLRGRAAASLTPPLATARPSASSSTSLSLPYRSSQVPVSAGHPLSDSVTNERLRRYDAESKGRFDRIVPVLQQLSALQHEPDFVERAQALASQELGYTLPTQILELAWVSQLDMRTLFAWCVFQAYESTSDAFFRHDPLEAQAGSPAADAFQDFLLSCGFHLLDITPCADGRLAHSVAYALRLPFSVVRRRPHAGALFDVENTVDRWVKTEHRRYREGLPNPAHADTRYLKVVVYHFSSLDSCHEGCAAHGSDDQAAAAAGLQRLQDFQQAVENSFCCGASVDLLLLGLDTDTDALRVHVPGADGSTDLNRWLDVADLHRQTLDRSADQAREEIVRALQQLAPSTPDQGMVRLLARLIENNLSQIDYVQQFHGGAYSDAGHAERFIGVGVGFKEIHLRNLTYFAHMVTVEEGAPDLDVGVKIFKGLNGSRGLPIPVVVRFDYHGSAPGARDRAISHCQRVQGAIQARYPELCDAGLLHTLLTIRDRDQALPAEAVGSSIIIPSVGGH